MDPTLLSVRLEEKYFIVKRVQKWSRVLEVSESCYREQLPEAAGLHTALKSFHGALAEAPAQKNALTPQ